MTDFRVFDVEVLEEVKSLPSHEYLKRGLIIRNEKAPKCKETEVPKVKEPSRQEKPEKYSDPIAIEEKRIKKNISSEELHSSSAE